MLFLSSCFPPQLPVQGEATDGKSVFSGPLVASCISDVNWYFFSHASHTVDFLTTLWKLVFFLIFCVFSRVNYLRFLLVLFSWMICAKFDSSHCWQRITKSSKNSKKAFKTIMITKLAKMNAKDIVGHFVRLSALFHCLCVIWEMADKKKVKMSFLLLNA